MTWELFLAWAMRFIHIATGIGAIGAPFFIRFALMPAANSALDDATHQKLREAIAKRWGRFVHLFILLFIISGTYNFLVETRSPVTGALITARWKGKDFSPEDVKLYHMLFGIKVLCAFVIFFLASALAGRSATFAPIRKNARVSITLLLLLAGLVIVCSTLLKFLPMHGVAAAVAP